MAQGEENPAQSQGASSYTEISQQAGVRRGCGSPFIASNTVMVALKVIRAVLAEQFSAVYFGLSELC